MTADKFQTEILELTPDWWQRFGKPILRIERACFGKMAYKSGVLKKDLRRPKNLAVLLLSGTQIIGFSYALLEVGQRANIEDTAILPEFQGQGLIAVLMGRMEQELKASGVKTITRDSAIANGYADSVERHYGVRILKKRDHRSIYGPQRYFQIAL